MNKKQERKAIHDKYGGRCSYCGDPLVKGWHADHILPVRRKYKYTQAGYYHKITKEKKPLNHSAYNDPDYEYKESKQVFVGMLNPENDTFENKIPACASCNINKHDMDIEEFRRFILRFINSLNKNNTQYKIAKRYGLIEETNKPVVFWLETYK